MITKDKIIAVVCIVILLLGSVTFAVFKADSEEETVSPGAMLEATNTFLGSGRSTMITADALYANLDDGYTGNDPFILSVRSAEAYETGHIPGAVNIAWRSVFTDENISLLPTNKQIVVYCFTGHTASQTTAMLNVMGYDAVCLKWGMVSWTSDATIGSGYYDRSAIIDNQVATGTEPGTWSGTRTLIRSFGCGGDDTPVTPADGDEGTGELSGIANSYMASGKAPAVSASSLYDNLNDGDTGNDPFLLSIRSSSQYEIGHVPGAINIGFSSLFTEENQAKLPTDDKQIVVMCYTGHTASQATALLNMNGYNATALKWGMTGWTTDTAVAPSHYDRSTASMNYPVVIGTDAGTLDDGVIADVGKVTLTATNEFLAAGKQTMITADALYANLNDGFTGNDPFILSVRSAEAYAAGHIPGAVNIAWRDGFTEENIALLPTNKLIVVYCFTGHTASQTTAMLNVLGYDAVCLKWGMCSWTTNTEIAPSCYVSPATSYQTVTGSDPGTWTRGGTRQCGDDDGDGSVEAITGSTYDIVRTICNNYLASGKPPAVSASSVFDRLNDADATNDPFLLSIRSSTQYAVGHIPGAVNIGFSGLFTDENLTKLPNDDRQIVVMCYTGHTASQATALLNINGFNATALKWGMTGWTTDTTIAPSRYVRGTACHNYPVVIGTAAGAIGDGVIAGKTDEEILQEASKAYLDGGPRYISAAALETLLSDTDETNDPFVLSIRSATDYAKGHIPTAVNMPWRSLFSIENLTLLPDDETQIVVVCYTGQTASHVTALLNVLGFNATTLGHGMGSWTNNTGVSIHFNATTHQMVNPTSSGTDPGDMSTATRQCGDGDAGIGVSFEGSSDEWEILRQACEGYIALVPTMYLTNQALFNNLDDGYAANDPYIISVRSAEAYAAGHVPTATNIAAGTLFDDTTLATLPTDKQIVVYCFTGQSAGHVSAMLNINGFNAISLKFGMCSWTNDTAITLNKCYNPDTAGNFRLILNSANPGVWADGIPAD